MEATTKMEKLLNLKDFDVKLKNPAEEALRRWRSAVTIVKNRRRRFRLVADLAKRYETEKKKLHIQEQLLTEDVMNRLASSESRVFNEGTEERSSFERVAREQRLQPMSEEERRRELECRRLAQKEEELELQPLIKDMEADIMDAASIESGVVNEDTEELSSLERKAEERQQALAGEMLLRGQELDPVGEDLRREREREPEQEERPESESFTPAPAARVGNGLSNDEETRKLSISHRLENLVHRVRRRKVDFEWLFVIINFILELPSAVFDQLSSVRKPQFALLSMLMSIIVLLICIIELVYKCRKEKVIWKWRGTLPWFYLPPSHKPFGSFKDIIGLTCAICQCVFSIITYILCLRHVDNPIKISYWPIIFAFGLLCSKFLGDGQHRSTDLPLSRDVKL